MAVRKRIWKTKTGESREAWVVDYADAAGDRHIETYSRKKDADARHAEVAVHVKRGVHVASSKSITVTEAAKRWADEAEAGGLERATVRTYRQHIDLHIVPFIGRMKVSEITVPVVAKFKTQLRHKGTSPQMIKKITVSLGSIIADAQEHGLVANNAVRELRRNKKRGDRKVRGEKRKLVVGTDIPTPDEISKVIAHAPDRWRAFLVVAAFTGLRASELRGLRWCDVDLKEGELHVRQRADRWNTMGPPKSDAGERRLPFGKVVTNTLREWRMASAYKADSDLVFCTTTGKPHEHSNLVKASLHAAQFKAGMVDADGAAKYTGLHALRHFYASWCINRVKDGGRGLPAKNVQERMGHSTITITLDAYGHLFRADDTEEMDAAELALIGGNATQTRHAR